MSSGHYKVIFSSDRKKSYDWIVHIPGSTLIVSMSGCAKICAVCLTMSSSRIPSTSGRRNKKDTVVAALSELNKAINGACGRN